jgi:hypothetical protein
LPIITMVTSSTSNISFRFTNFLWQDTPEDQLWVMWNTPYKLCGCQCTMSYIVISIVKMTISIFMPNLFGFLLQHHILATITEKASEQTNGHTCHIVVMSWTK